MRRLTYEQIKSFVESEEGNGCKLLTTEEDFKKGHVKNETHFLHAFSINAERLTDACNYSSVCNISLQQDTINIVMPGLHKTCICNRNFFNGMKRCSGYFNLTKCFTDSNFNIACYASNCSTINFYMVIFSFTFNNLTG